MSTLSCLEKRRSDGRGDFNSHKPISVEEVILAALVDNAEVAVALGVLVRQDESFLIAPARWSGRATAAA